MSNRANAMHIRRVRLASKRAIQSAINADVSAPTSSLAKRAMSYLPKGWNDDASVPRRTAAKHGTSDGKHTPDHERIVDISDMPMRWEREGPCLFDDCQQNRYGVYGPRGPSWAKAMDAGTAPINGLVLAREATRDELDLAIAAWAGVIKTYDHKGRVIDCRFANLD